MTWAYENLGFVLGLTITHLYISLVPLLVGSVVAVVLAQLIPTRAKGSVAAVLGGIYAVPSLALFVALPALIGTNFVGPTNVLIALTIYVVSAMFFSANDAFEAVPKATVLVAKAQGLSRWQRLIHVEFPLAIPGLVAGLRVASASTVSMASIGAVVGVRNLGYLFLDGFQRKIPEEILTGLFGIVLIAVAMDLGLWLIGKLISPWSSKRLQNA